MSWQPVATLLRELQIMNYGYGGSQLDTVRNKLGITTTNISVIPLSRTKNPSMTYKLTETLGKGRTKSWVVKFSPEDIIKQNDPWYDVHQEYDILAGLHRSTPPGPQYVSPAPIYRSTDGDRRVVGTKFIIMSFVEGKSFENAQAIPKGHRKKAFSSVMTNLAQNVHRYHWVIGPQYNRFPKEHTQSHTFWKPLISTWKRNYDAAVTRARSQYPYSYQLNNTTGNFFQQMSSANVVKQSHGETRIIHGDMNISNVIFDDQYNVKAIVDWKSFENGDPMVDVAYLCLTFMTPGDYGDQFRALNNHPLLLGYADNMESDLLREYRSCCNFSFNENRFNFAKAVCCLRWLSILQAAKADQFIGHESGEYRDNKDHTQLVMDCLATAGERFYIQSL